MTEGLTTATHTVASGSTDSTGPPHRQHRQHKSRAAQLLAACDTACGGKREGVLAGKAEGGSSAALCDNVRHVAQLTDAGKSPQHVKDQKNNSTVRSSHVRSALHHTFPQSIAASHADSPLKELSHTP